MSLLFYTKRKKLKVLSRMFSLSLSKGISLTNLLIKTWTKGTTQHYLWAKMFMSKVLQRHLYSGETINKESLEVRRYLRVQLQCTGELSTKSHQSRSSSRATWRPHSTPQYLTLCRALYFTIHTSSFDFSLTAEP